LKTGLLAAGKGGNVTAAELVPIPNLLEEREGAAG